MTTDWQALLASSDPQRIKEALDLGAVVQAEGVALEPASGRLIGICPFHEDHDPSFAVWTTDDGAQFCGCWSCSFSSGDLFDFLMRKRSITFSQALSVASAYLRDGLPPAPDPGEGPEPADFSAVAAQARDRRTIRVLHRFLEEKSLPIPAEWLHEEFMVGAEESGRILIPHLTASGEVVAAKWRTADRKPMSFPGSRLVELYGSWRDRGRARVILCEGESDAWFMAWLMRDEDVDVLGLPSGVSAKPRQAWIDQLRGRDVTLLFDADTAGRRGAAQWAIALDGPAQSVRVASLPNGEDAASAGSRTALYAVREAWLYADPAGLPIQPLGGRYVRQSQNGPQILSDFVFTLRQVVVKDDGGVLFEVLVPTKGDPQFITHAEFAEASAMRKWASARMLSWKGSTRDLQDLLELVKAQSLFIPRMRGTDVLGLHDGAFILHDCSIGTASRAYVPPETNAQIGDALRLCNRAEWDRQVPLALAHLHDPTVITPLLGWVAAAPLRSLCANFPIMALVGGAGWGKTTLVQTVLDTFGFWTKSPITITSTTPHGVAALIAATNAFPVWIDEYRFGARKDTKERLDQAIRDAWDGSAAVKGGLQENRQALTYMPAIAPIIITGEDAFSETSHAERMVIVPIPMEGRNASALAALRAMNREGFGRAYLEWLVAGLHDDRLPAPPKLLSRPEQARAVAAWGWGLLRQFCAEACGYDLPDFDDSRPRHEHEDINGWPVILEGLSEALDMRDREGYALVWVEGNDVLVRMHPWLNWLRQETDLVMPGGQRAVKKWLCERFPSSSGRGATGRFLRLHGAAQTVLEG